MREMNLDVVTRRVEILVGRIGFGLRSGNDFELERLARGRVEHRLVCSYASLANRVEVKPHTCPCLGHFIVDSKLMSLRREQFIASVAVRRNKLSLRRCRRSEQDDRQRV